MIEADMIARIAAAIAAAQAIAPTPAPAVLRPAVELHCIYDSAPAAVIARVGERMWNDDIADGHLAELLIEPAQACARQHGWNRPELEQAGNYALSTATIHHVRAHLAQSVPVASWDAIYEAVPIEERIRRHTPPMERFTDGAMRAMEEDPAAWSARPDMADKMGYYLGMRRIAEQAERAWAGLPIPD